MAEAVISAEESAAVLGSGSGEAKAETLMDAEKLRLLVENEPRNLKGFLDEARPDRERLRRVAQALAGTCWRKDDGPERTVATTPAKVAALRKLVAKWRALINQQLSADPLFHRAKG